MIELVIMIMSAFLMGKLFQKIKLPAILGWLVAGIVFGFHGLNLVSEAYMKTPWVVYLLLVLETTAGSLVGAELVWDKLKKTGKSIVIVTLFQSLFTFFVVTLAFGIVFYFTHVPLYLAAIIGGIALATAPAPSISIVSEYQTKGPVTDALIPMAALDDVVGIIVFFTINALVGSSLSGASFSFTPILVMIFGPILVGVAAGLVFGFISKYIKQQMPLLVVFMLGIFVTANAGYQLNQVLGSTMNLSYFMMGLSFCATFVNMVDFEAFEAMYEKGTVVISFALMIIIFSLGAPLDFRSISGAGILTFVYIGARMIGKVAGAYLGSDMMNMPDTVKKYLGLTLLPHSGVSLFFTSIASATLMPYDPAAALLIQSTIAAAAIINEIIAVLLAKKGFEKAGELYQAKQ